MFEVERPKIEHWCEDNGYSVYEHGIEESFQEFIDNYTMKYEIDGVESDGRLRIRVTTGDSKSHLAWYGKSVSNSKLSNGEVEYMLETVNEAYNKLGLIKDMVKVYK